MCFIWFLERTEIVSGYTISGSVFDRRLSVIKFNRLMINREIIRGF